MDLHRRLFVKDPVALRAFDGARLVLVADRVLRRLLDYDMLIPLRLPAKFISAIHYYAQINLAWKAKWRPSKRRYSRNL